MTRGRTSSRACHYFTCSEGELIVPCDWRVTYLDAEVVVQDEFEAFPLVVEAFGFLLLKHNRGRG